MSKKIVELESVIESKLSEFISGHQVVNGELTIKTSLEDNVVYPEVVVEDLVQEDVDENEDDLFDN